MSEQEIKRIYGCKDEVMLTVLSVILDNAADDVAILIKRNPNWTMAFIVALKARVNDAFINVLGIDPLSNQRDATDVVLEIQDEVLSLLRSFKLFLNPVFGENIDRKEEVLNKLGFTKFFPKANKKNIPALVELLYQFQRSMMDADLKAEITASKDISVDDITNITKIADDLKQKNVTQKSLQSSVPAVTADGILTLNKLYTAVNTNFAKLVVNFFKMEKPARANAYRFNVIKKLIQPVKTKKNKGGDPPATGL